MAASIQSLRNGLTPKIGVSREDLRPGDIITVSSVNAHTTYSWSMAFRPGGSTAAFSGDPNTAAPGTFTVDLEGPYLIRLVADVGLPTQTEQFVALRYLTLFGDLQLVAAGEQNQSGVPVPVDAGSTGWADAQNRNIQVLLGFIAKVCTVYTCACKLRATLKYNNLRRLRVAIIRRCDKAIITTDVNRIAVVYISRYYLET